MKEVKEEEKPTETLLEKAARLYPIGTKYLCATGDNAHEISKYTPRDVDGSLCNIEVGRGYVHFHDKWAEIVGKAEEKPDAIPKDWYYEVTYANVKACKAWLDAKGGKYLCDKSSKLINVGHHILSKHRSDSSYYFGCTGINEDSKYASYKELTDAQFKLVLARDAPNHFPIMELVDAPIGSFDKEVIDACKARLEELVTGTDADWANTAHTVIRASIKATPSNTRDIEIDSISVKKIYKYKRVSLIPLNETQTNK